MQEALIGQKQVLVPCLSFAERNWIPAKQSCSPICEQVVAPEVPKAEPEPPVSAIMAKKEVKEEKIRKSLMHTRYCLYYSDDIVQKGGRIKGELQY